METKIENDYPYINIYPNPFKTSFNISIANFKKSSFIRVIDMLGKEVFFTTNIENNNVINIENEKKGIYFIQIQNEEETLIKKVVKN